MEIFELEQWTEPSSGIKVFDGTAESLWQIVPLSDNGRMGSFTSAPRIPNIDQGDEDATFPYPMTWESLKVLCKKKLDGLPETLPRTLIDVGSSGKDTIRVMQWNILGQALADGIDVFGRCPKESLNWPIRRWRILHEIASMEPDLLCLQEVDHFKFLEKALSPLGFTGSFCPKPDSPCLYVPDNNGPDGCAIFVNTNIFHIMETRARILEIAGCQTNQVAIFCKLRRRSNDSVFWIVTTHLKAKISHFLAGLRREQGIDLISYIKTTIGDNIPLLLCGDLNADPSESVHTFFRNAGFQSVYGNVVPEFTTWTVRGNTEYAAILDYMLYTEDDFDVERILRMPTEEEIGYERVPSSKYPSDHFSLAADLVLRESNICL